MKFTMFRKATVSGVQEITDGDMTDGERTVTAVGAAVAVGAGLSMLVGAKGVLVGALTLSVGGLGKAFLRGFREDYALMVKANNQ